MTTPYMVRQQLEILKIKTKVTKKIYGIFQEIDYDKELQLPNKIYNYQVKIQHVKDYLLGYKVIINEIPENMLSQELKKEKDDLFKILDEFISAIEQAVTNGCDERVKKLCENINNVSVSGMLSDKYESKVPETLLLINFLLDFFDTTL